MINKNRSKSIICDENNNGKGVIVNCVICGEPFYVSNYYIEKKPAICCSKKCLGKYQSMENAPRWKGQTKEYRCLRCDKKFIGKQHRFNNKNNFCSNECYHAWCSGKNNYSWNGGKIERRCQICGKKIYVTKSYAQNRNSLFCSRECFKKGFSGENNHQYGKKGKLCPSWLGGISFEPYTLEFNQELKEQIRKKDGYLCQLCGKSQHGKKIPVHHINYDKTDSQPKNLICLCNSHNVSANYNRDKWQFCFEVYQEIRMLEK